MEPTSDGDPLGVLLVEDSPRIAERVRELLLEGGARVLATVDDEVSAIRALREMPVDLLILDLQLKFGTGFGVLESVGASRPPTIVMTNYALPQYRERARRMGIEHFLNKSLDFERLPEIVAQIDAERRRSGSGSA
jgi:DNA-binding response OmpR family regulator